MAARESVAGQDIDLVDRTIWIDAPPQAVFKLISDPARVQEWLTDALEQLKNGNDIPLGAADRGPSGMQILRQVPNERVVLAWPAGMLSQHVLPDSVIEFELRSHDGGTLLHLRQFLGSDQPHAQKVEATDRVNAVAGCIEHALQSPIPLPSRAERAAASLLFLNPHDNEGMIAYAFRRVASAIGPIAVVGVIAAMNLMFGDKGTSGWQTNLGLVALALSFVLANVFVHTVAGLLLRNTELQWQLMPVVISSLTALFSCYGFFWIATGQVHEGGDRADAWFTIAVTMPIAMVLYAKWFDAEVARRGAYRPIRFRTGQSCGWSLILIALCCSSPTVLAADPAPDPATRIGELAAKKYALDEPGAAVLVSKGGQIILSRGYGLSNLEYTTPITADTPFCIASVTKPLTATAILMLVEQGKLRLDDQVVDLLPDYPRHVSGVTVAHLLSHTSGIKNVSRLPEWRADLRTDLTVPEILQHFEALPLNFMPGEQWEYSNSGYILLGAILEKVTGKSYEEFIQENVFARAGMHNSCYGSHRKVIPNRAVGYQRTPEGYVNAEYVSLTRPYAAGAIISTANDLFDFGQALADGRLLKQETLEAAFSPRALNSGEPTSYGYGWMIGTFHGHRVLQHAGGMPGYTAQMWLLPDEEIFAVLLSNAPDKTDQQLIGDLVAAALGETRQERAIVRVDEVELKKYVGRYQLSSFGNDVITVRFADGKLTMHVPPNPVCELHATAPGEFFVTEEDIQITFTRDSVGQVPSLVLHHNGLDLHARRLEE
ncbi:MAG: serine hydrolase [Pirellulales bacterium]